MLYQRALASACAYFTLGPGVRAGHGDGGAGGARGEGPGAAVCAAGQDGRQAGRGRQIRHQACHRLRQVTNRQVTNRLGGVIAC